MSSPQARPTLCVHHLAVKVRDLARAEAFWAGALGLPVMRRQADESGAPRSIWLSLGDGAFLAVERADEGEPLRQDGAAGWHCVALGIPPGEREAWRARLHERGHPIVRETAYTLYVRDPEGAILALSHYPHPVAIAAEAPQQASGVPAETPAPVSVEAGPDTSLEARAGAGVTGRLAALVTLSALLLGFVLVTPGAAQRRRPDAMLIGSSSVQAPLGRTIADLLAANGVRVRRVAYRSSGLARPDFFDWQEEVPRLGDLSGLRGVIVFMGGNDTMALRLRRTESRDRGPRSWISWADEERWTRTYVARMRTFVESLCDAGARRAIVVLPNDGDREVWSDRIRRVQEAQVQGVRGTRCGIVVDPRGHPVRRGDTLDGVHLSMRGARTLLDRIGPVLVAALGR